MEALQPLLKRISQLKAQQQSQANEATLMDDEAGPATSPWCFLETAFWLANAETQQGL